MAVIAKMTVNSVRPFANGNFVNLNCVYDADISKQENEDVRFTKASPWGEATMTMDNSPPPSGTPLYLFFNKRIEKNNFDNALYVIPVRCISITDFGTSKQVEIGTSYIVDDNIPASKKISSAKHVAFNLKMTIDNPLASIQFEPQMEYFISIFNGNMMTMDEALLFARS